MLFIDGSKVEYTKRDMSPGLRLYGLDICVPGCVAAVANIGAAQSHPDTSSVIDMTATPVRIIQTWTVGHTSEGIKCSSDGTCVAVVVMRGSSKPEESPFYSPNVKPVLYSGSGKTLQMLGKLPIGNGRRVWPSRPTD